jgi:3'(2'), 5'-bisphosphate nucleotidase
MKTDARASADLDRPADFDRKTDFDIPAVLRLILEAGAAVADIYRKTYNVTYKGDASPLTDADLASHRVLVSGLPAVSRNPYPILSEEGRNIPHDERKEWEAFWMIDPLDGTKEFIKRNGEFTINIALIVNGAPYAGFVYAPVPDVLYWGIDGNIDRSTDGNADGNADGNVSAYRLDRASNYERARTIPEGTPIFGPQRVYSQDSGQPLRIVASRSHLTPETEAFIRRVESEAGGVETASSGSSLKLCRVAEGASDLYPRFAPTMEWDTAAADAVCRAAGCYVISIEDRLPLRYNKQNLLNPWFLVGKDLYYHKFIPGGKEYGI